MKPMYLIGALLLLTALVIVPASAEIAPCVWHNGKCIESDKYDAMIDGATVIHNSKTGVDSKYRDTNPANSPEVWSGTSTCTLEGNVRAGYNTLTKEVELRNVLQQDNETGIILPILPDGTFRYDGLAQGDYILHIAAPNGGGADQYSKVHCTSGVARPEQELPGYAITEPVSVVSSEPEPSCKPIIITASDITKRHFWFTTYYAFDLTITGTNEGVWQVAHVKVIDSEDHVLLSSLAAVYGTHSYTVTIPVSSSHKNHNPLTVEITNSECFDDACTCSDQRGHNPCQCHKMQEGIQD
jgi:hypothetical protein